MAKATQAVAARTGNRYYGAGGLGAIVAFFANYVNFTGTSSRREYWWWTLWYVLFSTAMLIGVIAAVIVGVVTKFDVSTLKGSALWSVVAVLILYLLVVFALFVPSLSLTIRRYRDAGVPWWLYLVQMVIQFGATVWLGEDSNVALGVELVIGLVTFVITVLPTKKRPEAET